MIYVDDLHWYDPAAVAVQRTAIAAADVVFATYAHSVPVMYPTLLQPIGDGLRQHQLTWLPHAGTPQIFVPIQHQSARSDKKMLLTG
jgi:hypothetical protein